MDAAGEGSAGQFASTASRAPSRLTGALTERGNGSIAAVSLQYENACVYGGVNASSDQMTLLIVVQDAGKDCGFTQWLDEEFPEQATKHISSLMGSVGCLEKQVETLQEELDELRRRYVTDVQPLRSSRQP